MTTINELFPPEIADCIHKGLDIIEQKEALEAKKEMAAKAKKKERDAAYREIIFKHISPLLHKYVLPFEYRFDADPTKPEPSDLFYCEIPGLPMFSFTFTYGMVSYLLPEVDPNYKNGINQLGKILEGDISLLLAKLFEIKRKADYEQGKQPETEPAYEPFEDDGPNADPDVDLVHESGARFTIPGGCYVINESDLEKLVNQLIDKKLAHLNLL